jgi:hypothetical protein
MSTTESAEDEAEAEASSDDDDSESSSDDEEEDDELPADDTREGYDMYETEEKRVAFNPSVKSSPAWTQWQRALKRVFWKYIDEFKKYGKQKSSFKAYVLCCLLCVH